MVSCASSPLEGQHTPVQASLELNGTFDSGAATSGRSGVN